MTGFVALCVLAVTLEDVITQAEAQYPAVISAERDRERASNQELSAEGAFDPALKAKAEYVPSGEYENRWFDTWVEQPIAPMGARAFAGYRLGRGYFGPYDEKLLTNSGGELRAGIEVSLLRNRDIDERRGRLAIARAGVDVADASREQQILDVVRQTAQRYWDWVAAGQRLRVARALEKLAQDRQAITETRAQKGDLALIETVDNERLVYQRQAIVLAGERALLKAANDLSLYYRDANGEPIILTESDVPLEFPPTALELRTDENALAETFARHPDLTKLNAQRVQNEVEAKLGHNLGLPKLDAHGLIAQDFGEGRPAKNQTEFRVGLTFELPLRRRTAIGREAAANNALQAIEVNARLVRDRIRNAVRNAEQQAQFAVERISLLQLEVDRAARVEEGERIKARAGDSNLLLVNIREQSTADARARVIEALADFHRARADLHVALALPPSELR